MSAPVRVAVLGAGIMGAASALFLARRGARVTLIDKAAQPFTGASRWNEGKIHLGYLYAADPTLRTARRLLPGGLAFKALVESLIGTSLAGAFADRDETYLLHADSVVSAASTERYLHAVTILAHAHPDAKRYLTDLSTCAISRLSEREVEASYNPARVVAAYSAPERSVDTQWVADRFLEALSAEDGIAQRMHTTVRAVRRTTAAPDGPLVVDTDDGNADNYDFVINALWEGRPAIDAGMGLAAPAVHTHRYRVSAFVDTGAPLAVPGTVVATGPFGDVKSYSPTRFYVSWYTAGLLAEGGAIPPPPVPAIDPARRAEIAVEIFEGLGRIVPVVRTIEHHATTIRVEGGWVYAVGQGSLADRRSALHRRDRVGIERAGSYISVDTGKYSIAPWLALQIADAILPRRQDRL